MFHLMAGLHSLLLIELAHLDLYTVPIYSDQHGNPGLCNFAFSVSRKMVDVCVCATLPKERCASPIG